MHEPVLVLNANFEPLNVCSMRRAIGLILADKAAMVVNGRGHIHTIDQLLPRPSVIRLEHMIHRPRPRVKLNSPGSLSTRQLYLPVLRSARNPPDSGPHSAQTPGRKTYLDERCRSLP